MSNESRDPPEPEDLVEIAICSPSMRFGREEKDKPEDN